MEPKPVSVEKPVSELKYITYITNGTQACFYGKASVSMYVI